MQRGFVDAVVSGEATSATDAARIAGYSPGSNGVALRVQAHGLAQSPPVRAAIAAAFAAQGLDEGWVAGRLRTYGEDEAPGVRAPAVRSVELAARILGMLQPETVTNVDARSIIIPGAGSASIDALESLLATLAHDALAEPS
jgi:hypothetical protein